MVTNENELNAGELLTYNQIKEVLGGNYNTIRKIVDKFVLENDIQTSTVIRHNRSYTAFLLTSTNLAEIQIKLKSVEKNSKPLKMDMKTPYKNNEKIVMVKDTDTFKQSYENDNENIKKYEAKEILEISQKNNELENKIKLLEANLKDKEIEKEKLKNEKIKVEADLYKAQSDILLITDKQKTFENNYFEQKQKNEILIKENKKQTNIINVLAGLLIVLITILATAYIVLSLK